MTHTISSAVDSKASGPGRNLCHHKNRIGNIKIHILDAPVWTSRVILVCESIWVKKAAVLTHGPMNKRAQSVLCIHIFSQ